MAAPGSIDGGDCVLLLPLAQALWRAKAWTGATPVYRALLVAILDGAYSPPYCHGARYWASLEALAQRFTGLMPLEPPEAFEARIPMQTSASRASGRTWDRAGADAADPT